MQDDAGAAISYLSGQGINNVIVIYDSTLGSDPVDGVNRAVKFYSMTAGFVQSPPPSLTFQFGIAPVIY